MPNMADITVKKNDGTTDVIYSQIQPFGGPDAPAIWKNQTVGSTYAAQPEMRALSKATMRGGRPYQDVRTTYRWPITTVNGTTLESVSQNGFSGQASFQVDQNQSVTDLNEAASQYLNLLASALHKAIVKAGRAPI